MKIESIIWQHSDSGRYLTMDRKLTHIGEQKVYGLTQNIDQAYAGMEISHKMKARYKPIKVTIDRVITIVTE